METLEFRVDTMALLHEIADCAISQNYGVLKVPLNVFRILLGQVAKRAIELNDKELHILMLELGLYEVEANEIPKMIKKLSE
ncbi:hypothetical protein FACS189432_05160 [Bacteroidia bacterium]|nr:hypothetical protein FACS189426_06610 [Bacteroidia bacterium]GHT27917.1 hypothetical protein FACS189432_05160 [Bacteroidia bacterium]